MKVVKSIEDAGLLVKSVSEVIKNEAKEQNGGFLIMVLCTLDASLLQNLLTGKGVKAKIPRKGVMKAGEGTTRAVQGFNTASSLTNFEIQKILSKWT